MNKTVIDGEQAFSNNTQKRGLEVLYVGNAQSVEKSECFELQAAIAAALAIAASMVG
jgi:hypothetical protein